MFPCTERGYSGRNALKNRRVRNSIYSTVKDLPPSNLPPETLEWIRWREARIPEWKSATRSLRLETWRMFSCVKQWQSVPMEVTEHDA
jgi:hypothetical protein